MSPIVSYHNLISAGYDQFDKIGVLVFIKCTRFLHGFRSNVTNGFQKNTAKPSKGSLQTSFEDIIELCAKTVEDS